MLDTLENFIQAFTMNDAQKVSGLFHDDGLIILNSSSKTTEIICKTKKEVLIFF